MSYRQRVGAQIAAAQRDHEAVSQAFRRVFSSPEGHIVLDEIMRRCGVDARCSTRTRMCAPQSRPAGCGLGNLALGLGRAHRNTRGENE